MMSNNRLREEFEPLLISPFGLHANRRLCQERWECDPGELEQFGHAMEWLNLWSRTKRINEAAGTSYGLKHAAERWYRERGRSTYISNGHLIMAAHRLGFLMKGINGNYCFPGGGYRSDVCNVYLNISKKAHCG